MNSKLTSINVEQEVKKDFLDLQRKHRYKNASHFVQDMVFFFESNDITPRQKKNIQKQMELFRESLFKKIGALERDYHKPHYGDFNLVSQYIKDQFETTQKMISDLNLNQASNTTGLDSNKEVDESISNSSDEILKKKIEGFDYVLTNFENKFDKKGKKLIIDEVAYSELKLSLMNILERD